MSSAVGFRLEGLGLTVDVWNFQEGVAKGFS